MKGHEQKFDWTYKEEDTYTLSIKNPTVEEEGTYQVILQQMSVRPWLTVTFVSQLIVRELDNMKAGCYITVKGRGKGRGRERGVRGDW